MKEYEYYRRRSTRISTISTKVQNDNVYIINEIQRKASLACL